jgi:hypothetical protein
MNWIGGLLRKQRPRSKTLIDNRNARALNSGGYRRRTILHTELNLGQLRRSWTPDLNLTPECFAGVGFAPWDLRSNESL